MKERTRKWDGQSRSISGAEVLRWSALAVLAGLPALAVSQTIINAPEPQSATVATTTQPDLTYHRPTESTNFRHYALDVFGPLPIAIAAVDGGIDQADQTPPEWNGGASGYMERFGSDFAIEAIGTTARYALASAFREDTHYYRCVCKGFFPRVGHAVVSTLTARRGDDGHTVFSVPALVAPYAGSLSAVYGWYPSRYDGEDALRMGNYTMLDYAGMNVLYEFFGSPHAILVKMHMAHASAAPASGTTP